MSEVALSELGALLAVIAVTSTLTALLNTYRRRADGAWLLRVVGNASAWFAIGLVFLVPWLLYFVGSSMNDSSCGPEHSSPPPWPAFLPLASFLVTPIVVGLLRLSRARPMRPLVYLGLYVVLAPALIVVAWALQEGWAGEICMWPTLPVEVGGVLAPSAAALLDLVINRRNKSVEIR